MYCRTHAFCLNLIQRLVSNERNVCVCVITVTCHPPPVSVEEKGNQTCIVCADM